MWLSSVDPGLQSLPVDVRVAVANGSNHIGATPSVVESDQRLLDHLRPRAREPFKPVAPGADAAYAASYECDLSTFEPLVLGFGNFRRFEPPSWV